MSLAIPVDAVSHVLLQDGWHIVEGNSFKVDSYEYKDGDRLIVGGQAVPSTGAMWKEPDGVFIVCPLTAVLAVKATRK
jgi:hypothetical protein